uniref:Uncharacterized protein n=1 Tax=Araneus ventricosus TaxID=182803 RepID=A0A4Y2MY40_ARAVE|nr:hypothetical protein AVEN_13496-1 [Araneus ventricosus]
MHLWAGLDSNPLKKELFSRAFPEIKICKCTSPTFSRENSPTYTRACPYSISLLNIKYQRNLRPRLDCTNSWRRRVAVPDLTTKASHAVIGRNNTPDPPSRLWPSRSCFAPPLQFPSSLASPSSRHRSSRTSDIWRTMGGIARSISRQK